VTTAVHWGWTPSHRVALRPRAAVVVAAGITLLTVVAGTWFAAPFAPLVALALALGLAVAVAVDAAALLRTAEASLRRTTAEARVPGRAETNDLDTELRRRFRPDGVPDPELLRQPL
jgi:hypothetical protein